jgi:hypothetical protein
LDAFEALDGGFVAGLDVFEDVFEALGPVGVAFVMTGGRFVQFAGGRAAMQP